jgi:Protein of unknown function (DUF1572)
MNILLAPIQELFLRDLNKLHEEISAYTHVDKLWLLAGDIKNSGGNLCLHLCGNLQHFIGAVLGNSGYQRNRDAEFASRGLSKEILLKEIEATRIIVPKTLPSLDPTTLQLKYPIDVLGKPMTTGYFLIHLYGHLNYHLGQINYHRRLIA